MQRPAAVTVVAVTGFIFVGLTLLTFTFIGLAMLLASGFFPGAVKEAAFRIQNLRMFISGAASLAFAGWLAAICLGLLRMALGVVMPVLMLATLTRPHVKEAFAEAGAIRRKET